MCGKNIWGCPIEDFLGDKLKTTDYEFIKKIKSDEDTDGDKNEKLWIGKAFDLSSFMDEKATIDVINKFVDYAEKKGIKINKVQQAV